jgi:eukaryotic-like serine/threonine-protein kinase
MPTSQPTPRMDPKTFLENVQVSGLLKPGQLDSLIHILPTTDSGRVIAKFLVDNNYLTKFQAERLLAGKVDGFVLGQYRILDQIGKGGMGRVFKAEHMTMGRRVALKMVSSGWIKTEKGRVLFDREVRAAAKLNHPNIVTAYDANHVGNRFFMVMEFVDGPNLQELVKGKGPLPVAQACNFIRQAAIGLNYAHELGMVHRDIKPANLLVQRNTSKSFAGRYIVKILDFGLARLSTPEDGELCADSIVTGKQTVLGTPDYLSPEQARNLHDADCRSDFYSLGCTFYYLLTGQVPHPGGTALEKMVRHATDPFPRVTNFRSDVPDEIIEILEKMTAKDPAKRFQNGSELANALAPFIRDSAAWIPIAPIPQDKQLDPSGYRKRPVIPSRNLNDDPWSNLDDELHLSPPTVEGHTGSTKETRVGGPTRKLVPPVASKDGNVFWLMIVLGVITSILLGLVLTILLLRHHMT